MSDCLGRKPRAIRGDKNVPIHGGSPLRAIRLFYPRRLWCLSSDAGAMRQFHRMSIDIADPRACCAPTGPIQESLVRLAEASLAASSASRAEEIDATLVSALAAYLQGEDAWRLADLFSAAPSTAVARHIWRRLIDGWRAASAAEGGGRGGAPP